MKLIRNLTAEDKLRNGEDVIYLTELKQKTTAICNKLFEEASELAHEVRKKGENRENLIEEIVDVQDVTLAILELFDISFEELQRVANKKQKEKGTFGHFTATLQRKK